MFFVLDVTAQGICDRTVKVRDAILTSTSNLDCATVTAEQLSSIKSLSLREMEIASLEEDDFDGLSGLETLELDENSLTNLDANLFDGLSSLKKLYLHKNSLSSLDANLFDDLSNLEHLTLNDNSLTSLDANLFNDLSKLRILSINNNSLTGLDVNLFDGLSNLAWLFMYYNSITALPADLFDGLHKLERLFMFNNSLTYLDEDLFDGLSNMKLLYLYNNKITHLPGDLFNDLSGLKNLYLGGNNLTTLPEDLFNGIEAELLVGLNNNPMRCFPRRILYLRDAGIVSITYNGDFHPCPSVTLSLTLEEISEVDETTTTVTARLGGRSSEETTIQVSVTPESDQDYELSPNVTLTIAAGKSESTEEVMITAKDNNIYTGDRTFKVKGKAINYAGVSGPSDVTLTILDDELPPTVTFAVEPSEVSEDDGSVEITLTAMMDAALNMDTELTISVGDGTALAGTDYEVLLPFDLTIDAYETEGMETFTFTPILDHQEETDETVLVTGTAPVEGMNFSESTIMIFDPIPKVTLVLTPDEISETGGQAIITAHLDAASSAETSIQISTSASPPATESDYVFNGNPNLTIPIGATTTSERVTVIALPNDIDAPDKILIVSGQVTNAQGVSDPDDVILTIRDDDEASTVSLLVSPALVHEHQGSREITITAMLDVARNADTPITVSVEDGTAESGMDYEIVSSVEMTILAKDRISSETFRFTPIPNELYEPDRTVFVTGTTPVQGLSVNSASLTLIDPIPEVMLELTPPEITEAEGQAIVTANLSAESRAETVITISTNALFPALDSDYSLSPNRTLRIAAGAITSSDAMTITAVDNEIDEQDKIVTVIGMPENSQGVIAPENHTLTITNDDKAAKIRLSLNPTEVIEEVRSTPITVTAMLDVARSTETEVMVSVESGTATSGEDFADIPSFILTIPAKETQETKMFSFLSNEDHMDEPNETVRITGMTQVHGLAINEATLRLIDSDPAPEVSLQLTPDEINEHGDQATVTASLSVASSAETRIGISMSAIFPALDSDYTLSGSPIFTIPPGARTSGEFLTITAVDNPVDTPHKMVTVSGQVENILGFTAPQDEILTILDDDEATGITLMVNPSEVSEDAGRTPVTVTATLDVPRGEETRVTVSVRDGSAVAVTDYQVVHSFDFIIPADQSIGNANFDLMPLNDFIHEQPETITIIGKSSALGPSESVTYLTILDDDELITLAIQDLIVSEADEVARVDVDVSPAAPIELNVPFQLLELSATEGKDYAIPQGVMKIHAGTTTGILEVPIINDPFTEPTETFEVRLLNVMGTVLDPDVATVSIEDDDIYRLSVEDASAYESDQILTFMVTINPPHPSETVLVEYETMDGTALANMDYVSQRQVLQLPPNTMSRQVSIRLVDDEEKEQVETFSLRLLAHEYAVVVEAEATGTIIDDDAPPQVNITRSVQIDEHQGPAHFKVTLSHGLSEHETEVYFMVAEGTASELLDYMVLTQSPLIFAPGKTETFIEVDIVDDILYEGDETFQIQLTNIVNGLPGQSDAQCTIVDNETPVTVSIQDVEVSESEPEAVFVVGLSGQSNQPLTFTYTTEDQSAKAGQDYEAVRGEIMFALGELFKDISVPILDDQDPEPPETFRLLLSGGDLSDMEVQGRIKDDDGPLTVSIHGERASEADGSLMLPVRLNLPSSQLVTVQFASSDVTAIKGSDYVSSRGIVIFEPGSTDGKIHIQIIEDSEEEPVETFQVMLSKERHVMIDESIGTGTILDNDGISSLSLQSVTVFRGAAIFEMNLSRPSILPVLVSYATEDGTAYAGEDYEPVAGQVTFAPGEVSKTIEVKLLSGERIWEAKTFALVLLSAVNAEVKQARTEAVMEAESEENIQNAYVSRVLRTWASQVVEALSQRMEGMAQCKISDLSWLQYGTEHRSLGQIFSDCGAEFTNGGWSIWGQGAYSRMRGQDGVLSLSSDVTTMLLGADYAWHQGWMAGLLAAQSWDQGTYETPTRSGTASSRLTSFYPYVSYQMGTGMRAWMLLGLGRGASELETLDSELDATLIALGLTGTLTRGSTGRLGYEVDAFWATADMETGSDLGVRRFRAGMEGSLRLGGGMDPYMEATLRQDGGDAETGMGVELGGGMRWSTNQLRAEFGGRTLVLHTDEGLREWGMMVTIEYGTSGGLGPSMRIRPLWGNVYGGELWREAPLHSMGLRNTDQRVEMELGYGVPIRESLGQSTVGMTLDPMGRAYRVGYNLHMKQGLQVSVATTARTMEANEAPPSYGISARMDLKW